MATVAVLTSIGIIIVSFIGAFIFYYVVSPLSRVNKKQVIEEVISHLINFVIFVWVGKVLLHLPLFVRDPFAVLAYPSNSQAFYVAFLFSAIHLSYKVIRRQFKIWSFWFAFVPIFLVASFIYEFIQIVWMDNTIAWPYLGLLLILLISFMVSLDRWPESIVIFILMIGWNVGKVILAFALPFTTIFGYTMSLWFLVILLIVNITLLLYYRKRVTM